MDVTLPVEAIKGMVYLIRENKVLLDSDLAEMYGVESKALNQAVKRNIIRFPPDFMFQLTEEEYAGWNALRSQTVTLKKGRGAHRKY